jgi:ATP-dependent helicase Lhr and Lhr-like helicase
VDHLAVPEVDDRALQGLKFSAALPRHLAEAILSERCADLEHAALALIEPHRFSTLV